ncbi:MAG: hypothetical protein FWC91_13490, partial [Defluviitaleaceae bacterium]|nr:hypothetical protein [Defluviitaleaceae bacterium]
PTPEPPAVPTPTPEPPAVPTPTPELPVVPTPTPEPPAVPTPTPEPPAVSTPIEFIVTVYPSNPVHSMAMSFLASPGETITLVAQPSLGYTFSHWRVDGGSPIVLNNFNSTPATFIMPARNVEIVAYFQKFEDTNEQFDDANVHYIRLHHQIVRLYLQIFENKLQLNIVYSTPTLHLI